MTNCKLFKLLSQWEKKPAFHKEKNVAVSSAFILVMEALEQNSIRRTPIPP